MSEQTKKIMAGCLIVSGLVLLGYNFLRSSQPMVHGQKVEQTIDLDSLFSIDISGPAQDPKADILALFVLKSDVCPPCVNNTFDYIDLLSETEDRNIVTTALFVETEPEKAHRFVKITELPISYRIAIKEKLPVSLKNTMQELLFIDTDNKEIFYRLIILGNITSELEYKREILDQAFTHWSNIK